ncbi:ubiquitin carboxyl-terminal hydrolase 22 [Anthonomus grandis grandis]|uniref:ubiquitin carboxyl-terminal hydrolase 22 n=1 Tax=Anthonomus grandis grandis TaxID=2921223 RepID=UPI002164F18D|nr:ubiquitin carboxyl-terminal hydrolase 22 [Anthonomus grandis grandis]
MNALSCEHFERFKEDSASLETLKWIHSVFVVGHPARYRSVKILNTSCQTCRNRGPHIHACIECVYFGCIQHIRQHTRDLNHTFSLELIYGQLHCAKCGDYIYDNDLDEVAQKHRMHSRKFQKRLFDCVSWDPNEDERQLISNRTKRMCLTPETTLGLRGLINLGATCFMNCIVQALMHTPLLRDYFLSEPHCCKGVQGACLVCEVSKLFQEFYNGDTTPLALHELLHLIWTHASHLCGDKQHDAHEFFMAALDLLHKHYSESNPKHNSSANNIVNNHVHTGNCSCIIHQIFSGRLQSDVVCQICNGVSTTTDPTMDFALDLGSVTEGGRSPCSLIDCLESFTKAEHLGREKIMCENCGSKQESTKQLTIKTLPIVATFHLKRFSHSDAGIKISTAISFPEMIDMTPFMSKRKKEKPFPSDNRYSLFAVVNHSGDSANEGHYIAFVRQHLDYWYKCNDEVLTPVKLKDVLSSEGYILFYHKQVLGYE